MDQLIGQVLHSRYQVQTLLGRQIGRRTLLATDLLTQSLVVVKLLLFGPDFTWEDLKLFEREAETLKNLSHPSIPNYLDFFELDTELGQGFALVQSYIEARSLQDWTEAGRTFSEADLKAMATQLLEVLNYLHSRQPPVIHRDIKPSNILLGHRSGHSPGQVYLVDFGSVQTVAHGGTITVVGTYGYMPPEQFGGRTTPASDLYSLGATLIYLLTGIHPADLPKRRGILKFDPNIQISDSFRAWLQGMIQPEVEERFTSVQQALELLQNDSCSLPIAQSIPAKPQGSRVLIKKTDDQLQIVIPSLPGLVKLRVLQKAIVYTFLIISPLLAFLGIFIGNLSLIWLLMPLLGWGIFRVWESALHTCFEEIEVLISDRGINYSARSWLGRTQSYSALVSEVTRLESSNIEYSDSSKLEITYLNIWIGNYCCPLSSPKSLDQVRRLTRPEVDWLSFELSDWLGLPIQQLGENKKIDDLSQQTVKPTASSDNTRLQEENLQDNLIHKSKLTVVQRPGNAKCIIQKTAETIEISVYAQLPSTLLSLGCAAFFFGIPYFILVVAAAMSNPFIAILLGILPLVLWKIFRRLGEWIRSGEILVVIDRQNVSLVRQTGHEHRSRQCLRRVPVSLIRSVQIVRRTTSLNSSLSDYHNYHVQLKVSRTKFSPGHVDILVGNRRFWLSRQEAFWLASELSNWLGLPVTEVEVIQSRQ